MKAIPSDSEVSPFVLRNPSLHWLPLGPAAAERVVARAGGHEAADDDEDAGEDADANHGERDCLFGRGRGEQVKTHSGIAGMDGDLFISRLQLQQEVPLFSGENCANLFWFRRA